MNRRAFIRYSMVKCYAAVSSPVNMFPPYCWDLGGFSLNELIVAAALKYLAACWPVWGSAEPLVWLWSPGWPCCSPDWAADSWRGRWLTGPRALWWSLCRPPLWLSSRPGSRPTEETAPRRWQEGKTWTKNRRWQIRTMSKGMWRQKRLFFFSQC